MFDKEIFVRNLKEISNDMSNKEIAKIADCAPGTISKYHSSKYPDFYSVEMLMKLSEYFCVSIDWLIGRDVKKNLSDIGSKELCRIISTLYEKGDCVFRTVTHTEDCFVFCEDILAPQNSGFEQKERKNNYYAFILPNYIQPKNEDDCEEFLGFGNDHIKNQHINTFIKKMIKADGLLKAGGIDCEMYHDLIEKYIDDLPDR